jgi:CheY-like chemotaxis protein
MRKLNSIMLVDDDSITNFLNELLLKEMDISEELIITADGQKALEVLYDRCVSKGECPDLILLDVNMPVINGFEFLKRYNEMMFENKQSIVIVMLSTSLNPRDKEKAEALNVSDYLTKPLSKDRINELLEKYFN